MSVPMLNDHSEDWKKVREKVTQRVADLTTKMISRQTPAELLPLLRAEVHGLQWVLDLEEKRQP